MLSKRFSHLSHSSTESSDESMAATAADDVRFRYSSSQPAEANNYTQSTSPSCEKSLQVGVSVCLCLCRKGALVLKMYRFRSEC